MTLEEKVIFTDYEISPLILNSIEMAKKEVVLVSPYVNFWPHLINVIESAKDRGVQFTLLYRTDYEEKLEHKVVTRLFDKRIPVPLLHAKLYFFDDEIIMSSMNLLEFSQQSSKEIAVRLIGPHQKDQVRAYLKDKLMRVRPTPTKVRKPSASKKQTVSTGYKKKDASTNASKKGVGAGIFNQAVGFLQDTIGNILEAPGFCIRCSQSIQYDQLRPLCPSCFNKWNQYRDPTYPEKFCHSCGAKKKTSMDKPLCYECYKS